jgi:hypothetical protein
MVRRFYYFIEYKTGAPFLMYFDFYGNFQGPLTAYIKPYVYYLHQDLFFDNKFKGYYTKDNLTCSLRL